MNNRGNRSFFTFFLFREESEFVLTRIRGKFDFILPFDAFEERI